MPIVLCNKFQNGKSPVVGKEPPLTLTSKASTLPFSSQLAIENDFNFSLCYLYLTDLLLLVDRDTEVCLFHDNF